MGIGFIAVGTVFFGYFEACICPEDENCDPDPPDPAKCEDSGGVTKSYVDAFYMSVVTITTIGYGDIVPLTTHGRLFGILWMLLGVGSTLNLVGSVTDLLQETFESSVRIENCKEVFAKMDLNRDGNLDRHEFLRLQLIMLGLAQEEELDAIDTQFDLIDTSGNGYIDKDEFNSYYL